MNEEKQITYMQIRLIRMAAEKLNLSIRDVAILFDRYDVASFIRSGFAIFHVEGDLAVYEEVANYLFSKGVSLLKS